MSQNNIKVNGSAPRKQLSEQLDRLDVLIDALDAGLNEVVADAVRKAVAVAVTEAVAAVVRELLSNAEVLRVVAAAAQPQPQPAANSQQPVSQPVQSSQSGVLSRVRGRLSRAWNATVAVLTFVAAWTLSAMPSTIEWVRRAGQFVWKHRVVAGSALAAGVAVGCASYVAGPTLSSLALAACGAAASAAAIVTWPFARLWAGLTRQQS